jgi:hypothetical protein
MVEGFIVSSCLKYLDTTVPVLLESLKECPKENILVFVGDGPEYKEEVRDGVRYIWVPCHAYDNNAMWGYLNYTPDLFEKVFLLHDTCKAGPKFLENSLSLYDKEADATVLNLDGGWPCWCGLAMWDVGFLKRNQDFYEKYKCITKDTLGVDGGAMFRARAEKKAMYPNSFPPVVNECIKVYEGAQRMVEYFPGIDLYKYKANWYHRGSGAWVEIP